MTAAVVVILVVLATVPFPQRVSFQIGSLVTGPTQRGCGLTLFTLAGWTFPAGKLIHFSWTTNPTTDVFFNMSTILNDSFGPTFFSGYASSGTESFYANGGTYEVNVSNCEDWQTTVTVSAYYNFDAPMY